MVQKLNIGDKFVWQNEGIIYTVMDIDTSKEYGQVLLEWWSNNIYGVYVKKIMWDATVKALDDRLLEGKISFIHRGNPLGPKGSIKKLKLVGT